MNSSWIELRKELKSPVYSFHDIFFSHTTEKDIASYIGSEMADVVIEILSQDTPITEDVKNFIRDKANELNVPNERVDKFIKHYLSMHPAFRRLLIEVCKDGVITEDEQRILIEKAKQYGTSRERIIDEIGGIVSDVQKIRKSFREKSFYEIVIALFLMKFVNPNSDYYKHSKNRICGMVHATAQTIGNQEITSLSKHIVYSINRKTGQVVIQDDSLSIEKIVAKLKLGLMSHARVTADYCRNLTIAYSKDQLLELLKELDSRDARAEPDNNGHFVIGSESYIFDYRQDKNLPLFSFDSLGDRTIIKVNKSHYFYSEDLRFKLNLISIVANLKKNYAHEDLLRDVQQLFDPPAMLRIRYPEKDRK